MAKEVKKVINGAHVLEGDWPPNTPSQITEPPQQLLTLLLTATPSAAAIFLQSHLKLYPIIGCIFIINVQYFNSLVARPQADLYGQVDINLMPYSWRANEEGCIWEGAGWGGWGWKGRRDARYRYSKK